MAKTFKYAVVLALIGALSFATGVFAQWDVTETSNGEKGTSIENIKNKQMGLTVEPGKSVEMQADQVQYSADSNVATASGNVVVTSGENTIYADHMKMDRGTQKGEADGHVYMDTPQFKVDADSAKVNLNTQTGTFENARIWNDPFMIAGPNVEKVSDTHVQMQNGYLTTCDHDEPHFRLQMKRMDYYQGDKAVARGVKIYAGPVPVMYLPRYTQDLKNKPWFTFAPGHSKDLGYFLLTRSRMKINDYWTFTLRVDAYERTGLAWGMENRYAVPGYGAGLLRTYFINERQIAAKHPWNLKTEPTVVNERYQVEWRHKWDVDDRTNVLWQYYRVSDAVILPRYFEREFRADGDVSTYFLLTRAMPAGTLSFRIDHRVNRFERAVDSTPYIEYSLQGHALGASGFYLDSTDSFANLVKREPSPTEDRRKTMRFNTNNDVYYPTHISFVQFTPIVGGDLTYYSRTPDLYHPTNVVRTMFKTGANLSARFFKVFDLPGGLFGSDIKRMRHVIAPMVSYRYQHKPSFDPSRLNQFDGIDALDQLHDITFSIENKLQGKRGNQVVDLVRDLVSMTYTVKQKGVKGELSPIRNQLDITPNPWLRIYSDTLYDHRDLGFLQADTDFYIKVNDRLGFDIGDSYVRGGEHQVITQVAYVLNPKWKFRIYNRFLPNDGFSLKEEDYMITRDLHEWEMSFMYNTTRGSGTEFLLTFRLKAFPEQLFDLFGTSFNQRKPGSQDETVLQTP